MQISECKVASGAAPYRAAARTPRGNVHVQAQPDAAVDAVLHGLIGDFDRILLDSDNSNISYGVPEKPSEQGSAEQGGSAPAGEEELRISSVPRASWRSTSHAAAVASTVLSVRAGAGCASFYVRHSAKHAPAPQEQPGTDEKLVSQLFPESSYARRQDHEYKVAALLCAARLHDDLFGSRVLAPEVGWPDGQPQLGQQPPKTTVGSIHLRKALEVLNIHTELLTLQQSSADERAWTAAEKLFCIEDDDRVLQPVTEHLGSCWSGMQVRCLARSAAASAESTAPRRCMPCAIAMG